MGAWSGRASTANTSAITRATSTSVRRATSSSRNTPRPSRPRLRQPRVFPRVRFPFFALRGHEVLRLLAHVIEHGRVARQLLDAGLAVELGIEAAFEQADGERTLLQDLPRPLHARRL